MSAAARRRTDAGPPKGRHHGAIAATDMNLTLVDFSTGGLICF